MIIPAITKQYIVQYRDFIQNKHQKAFSNIQMGKAVPNHYNGRSLPNNAQAQERLHK